MKFITVKILIIFVYSLLFNFYLCAQDISKRVSFDEYHIDYGNRVTWYRGAEQYRFKNLSDDTLYIVQTIQSERLKVFLPKKGIPPGKFGFIEIVFSPVKKGIFHETIDVITNFSDATIQLSLTGKIELFDNSNQLSCPSFTKQGMLQFHRNKNISDINIPIKIIVQDSINKRFLDNSFVYFEQIPSNRERLSITGNNGTSWAKLQYGNYFLKIYKEGYQTKLISNLMIDDEIKELYFYLEKENSIIDSLSNTLFNENKLLFLLDHSTSMSAPNYLNLAKSGLKSTLSILRKSDLYAIMAYADSNRILKSFKDTNSKEKVIDQIVNLRTKGNTKGSRNIKEAYKYLIKHYQKDKTNHLIIITDGVFNGGSNDHKKLIQFMASKSNKYPISISLLLVGKRAKNQAFIQSLKNYLQIQTFSITSIKDAKYFFQESIKNAARK